MDDTKKEFSENDRQAELLCRHELAGGRIREIADENLVPGLYRDYFRRAAAFLIHLDRIFSMSEDDLKNRTMEECLRDHDAIYGAIRDHYDSSYANPDYAVSQFGTRGGQILSFLAAELFAGIAPVFEKRTEEWVILQELFIEIYNCFADPEGADLQEAQQTIYWYFHDYSEIFTEDQMADLTEPADNLYTDLVLHADLSDLRYLYRYGLPIGENEIKTAEFLNRLPESDIQAMADTYTEGYRIGFEVTGRDLTKKKTAGIEYAVGFERVVRASLANFSSMGLAPAIAREKTSSFFGIGNKRGVYSTSANRQFDYDHREDRALYLDKRLVEHRMEMLEGACERHKTAARLYAGPAVQEVFGEVPFAPQEKDTAIRFSKAQQQLMVYQMSRSGQIINRYIPGEERSFTIIAYPVPAIGKDYEDIFRETVRINTLDYQKYRRMQQKIIDVLDTADTVHIQGAGDNETDLTVSIWKLEDPKHQTAFENCVADVNIPVGEVFTSPVLKNTNGLLHVSEVYLNGLQFKNLKLWFEDGIVRKYSCSNFPDEKDNERYVRDHVLMHHEWLPMGEFAIGTNTTAYRMGKIYHINDRLPILIAEKTGPHFAVGDTCYSQAEDTKVYNPDGKEIMPRDNEITQKRRTDPESAYFNCHTDITIPFEELKAITAIRRDQSRQDVISDGRFVIPGTEELNKPLDSLRGNL